MLKKRTIIIFSVTEFLVRDPYLVRSRYTNLTFSFNNLMPTVSTAIVGDEVNFLIAGNSIRMKSAVMYLDMVCVYLWVFSINGIESDVF